MFVFLKGREEKCRSVTVLTGFDVDLLQTPLSQSGSATARVFLGLSGYGWDVGLMLFCGYQLFSLWLINHIESYETCLILKHILQHGVRSCSWTPVINFFEGKLHNSTKKMAKEFQRPDPVFLDSNIAENWRLFGQEYGIFILLNLAGLKAIERERSFMYAEQVSEPCKDGRILFPPESKENSEYLNRRFRDMSSN